MNLWRVKLIILPCNKCKYYWQDLKWCTKWEKASFSDKFEDMSKKECFSEKKDINMCSNREEFV